MGCQFDEIIEDSSAASLIPLSRKPSRLSVTVPSHGCCDLRAESLKHKPTSHHCISFSYLYNMLLFGLAACLLFQSASTSLLCNSQLCPASAVLLTQRGDKKCDLNCYTQVCDFDKQVTVPGQPSDCENSCHFSEACIEEMLGNGVCDEACNSRECGWDLGDCGACAKGCLSSMLGNKVCDTVCNVMECVFDHYDCGLCQEDCSMEMLGNEQCDPECLFPECQNDQGDCDGPECDLSLIGDGHCDAQCDVPAYNFDGGDCLCSPGCNWSDTRDTVCQPDCNVESCDFDGGYCVSSI